MKEISWIPLLILGVLALSAGTAFVAYRSLQMQAQPAEVVAQPAENPPPETPDPAEESPQPTQVLKGKDFTVKVLPNGNNIYRDLIVTTNDGTTVDQMEGVGGKLLQMKDVIFNAGDAFEIQSILPGEPREQLVVKGRTLLPEGYGILGNFQVYLLEGHRLIRIFDVLTERDLDATDKYPALKLQAEVKPTMENGQPAYTYRYKSGKAPYRSLVFHWDGHQFTEPTGVYRKIEQEYTP